MVCLFVFLCCFFLGGLCLCLAMLMVHAVLNVMCCFLLLFFTCNEKCESEIQWQFLESLVRARHFELYNQLLLELHVLYN